ncbi:MAG TPA: pyridoxal 5'-phosphate synthase glutaminase subunit PdxT [Acidimicrobiales bacterium]|nr:pyridoxal 5'-phosphate synthase glutaminase subunit PdxT [Acidimicrobiales bacterium]
MPRVGVLALQGDVREHSAVLTAAGAEVTRVRKPEDLDDLDGLVMPGGESTAIAHLLETSGLRKPLGEALDDGLAVLGTCAGLILLSDTVLDGRGDQWSFGALDVAVRRNGYGRQIASFETEVDVKGIGHVHGVFIRAPRIETWSADIEVLATLDHGDGDHPVLVRQGAVLGCAFHPELAAETRIHQLFLDSLPTR